MAEFLEVHRNTISGWLGDRSKPMPILLRIWATQTQVPIEWLRDGVWPELPQKAVRTAGKPAAAQKRTPAKKVAAKKVAAKAVPVKAKPRVRVKV